MPYAVPLTHVRAEGVFGTTAGAPVEEWSFGMHYSGARLPAGYDSVLPTIWNAVAAYISSSAAGTQFSNTCWLTEVMAASVDADGSLSAGYYSRYAGTPVSGGSTTPAGLPLTTSFCVTLDAGKPAAGRYGRFYPPPQYATISLGQCATADALAHATAAKTMLEAVENALGPDVELVVASKVHGTNRGVTNIRAGRVPDTQRRRRNSLPEGYQSVPI